MHVRVFVTMCVCVFCPTVVTSLVVLRIVWCRFYFPFMSIVLHVYVWTQLFCSPLCLALLF